MLIEIQNAYLKYFKTFHNFHNLHETLIALIAIQFYLGLDIQCRCLNIFIFLIFFEKKLKNHLNATFNISKNSFKFDFTDKIFKHSKI